MGRTHENLPSKLAQIEVELNRYVRGWGPIRWRDELAGVTLPKNPQLAAVFRALADIEADAFYMRTKLRYAGAMRVNVVDQFTSIWLAEESEHARALACISDKLGGADAVRGHGLLYRDKRSLASTIALVGARSYPVGVLALYLTLGALQEYIALTTYNYLADIINDGNVSLVLKQIARQEGRHMRFYSTGANIMLRDSPINQALFHAIMKKYWRPPGVDLLGKSNWVKVFDVLLRDENLRRRYLHLDEIYCSFEGQERGYLMGAYLESAKV